MARLLRYLIFSALFIPAAMQASTLSLGVFSFDNLIPGGASPGVNVFDVSNYTGSFDLPPDFPVTDAVTLTGAVLTVDIDGGGSQQISLGDIGPGVFNPPDDAEFPDTTAFTDAVLTATLDLTSLQLDDGSTFNADPRISATILPSTGTDLVAGTDFAVISASEAITSTPEPGTVQLTSITLGAIFVVLALRRTRSFPARLPGEFRRKV